MKLINMCCLLLLLFSSVAFAGEIKLRWDIVAEATGYKLHYGTDPENLTQIIDVGNVSEYTVIELITGTTYYFKASCYSAIAESELSSGVYGKPKLANVMALTVE